MSASFQSKIVSLSELLSAVKAARQAGESVVQCHGCFDIVHPGHIRYLEFARQQGDVLIVSLTGDSDISKGDQRPYIPQELRAENLAALMFVDFVYVTPDPTAVEVLGQVKPDVYVKGREYEHSNDAGFLAEKNVVEGYGGRIIFSSGEIVFSSTDLIERVGARPETESHRLNFVCRRYRITAERIQETLERFRDLHVLVVGDVVIDRYVLCDTLGVASESPMISLVERDGHSYVGGAAIVARHLAALGAHAFLLTAGGEDKQTEMVTDVLGAEGIEAHLIESRAGIVEKTRYLADDSKLFKVDRGQRHPLDTVSERRAALILEQQSKIADAVIFCDFGYGMITEGLLGRVSPTLRHNVRVLSADVSGGRAGLPGFKNFDLLCPTEREVRTMLNDFSSGLSSVAWHIMDKTQVRHLFVTLEKRGMVVFERRSQQRGSPEWSNRLRSEQLPSFADHAVDRLGCGDALLAAATLSLAAGEDLMRAAYLGNAAAALELAMLGNRPVEFETLQEWLGNRRELAPKMHEREPAYASS
ncbi:MAG: adenylyltransferase/cytidyltransferase family protein [Phycisphaerales bacterium]|nr:MAG: adenylyltransferase/cytidyltransferase family protein [Phycisphaerales bacterium]